MRSLIVLAVVFWASSLEAQDRKPLKEVVKEAQDRCVIVKTLNNQGSGVIIEKNRVLVPFHLLEFNSPVFVDDMPAKILAISTVSDLVLLEVETKNFSRPLFGKVEPSNTIFYVGSPLGLRCAVVFGQVIKVDNLLYTSAIPQTGFSGSAVWLLNGDMVGFMTMMRGDKSIGGWFSVAVLGWNVLEFLKENQEDR